MWSLARPSQSAPRSLVSLAFAEVSHQLGEREFHLVLHLGDQLILAHADMVERLGIRSENACRSAWSNTPRARVWQG